MKTQKDEFRLSFTKEQSELIKSFHEVSMGGEELWFYIPYWFRENKDGTFTVFSFEKLPQDLRDFMKLQRNQIKDVKDKRKFPEQKH